MKTVALALIVLVLALAACSQQPTTQLPPPPPAQQVVQTVPSHTGASQNATADALPLAPSAPQTPSRASDVVAGPAPAQTNTQPSQPAAQLPPASTDAETALKTLLKRGAQLTFSVTYDVTETARGQTLKSTLAFYTDTEESRMDIRGTVNGQQLENRAFFSKDVMIACAKQPDWQCIRFDAANQTANIIGVSANDTFNTTLVTRVADRSIAGTRTACFTLVTTTPIGTVTEQQCYSPEGVPLALSVTSPAGSMTREANTYSLTVAPSAFTPPATPQSVQDALQQPTQ